MPPQEEMPAAGIAKVARGKEEGPPDFLRPFFWDVDFDRLNVKDGAHFIINRLLEHGDESSARFLLQTYSQMEIIRVVKASRSLSRRSRGFWMIYFGIEGEPCSPKQYPPPC
jgi:hypothetical protein